MSLTGRPSRPPLALMSSSQIFMAEQRLLAVGREPPVSAMLKPILIGSLLCAEAGTGAAKSPAARRAALIPRRVM